MNEFTFEKYILLQSRKISRLWHLETHLEDIHQSMWAEYLAKKDKYKDDHYRLRMECWNAGRKYCLDEIYGTKGNPTGSVHDLKKAVSFVPLTYIVGASIIDERAENRELLRKIKETCDKKDKKRKIKYSSTLNILMENANGESRTYLDEDEREGLSRASFSFRVKQLRFMLRENNLVPV